MQNFKITDGMDETITLNFSVVSKKTICLRALLANSCQKNSLTNDELFIKNFQSSFHLATLEDTFMESLQLSLCRQKGFVYGLKLSRLWRK